MTERNPKKKKPEWNLIFAAIVAMLAVGYFSLTFTRTLNSTDEGLLLINFLKTATGEVPHRDFYDDYGPAAYWLGGGLFNLFGIKIIVIRYYLLIHKTAMALLVFWISRKLIPTLFAMMAAVFFILNWGDPHFPAINILYAGFVSHFLALLGVLFMIKYIEGENRLWLMGTAACLGMSALFKFHTAVFHFVGFSVFLSFREVTGGIGPTVKEARRKAAAAWASLFLRMGKLLGPPAVAIFYLFLFARDHLDLYYFFIFLFPYFMLLAHIFASDLKLMRGGREAPARSGLKSCYGEILTLVFGMSVFIVPALLYYHSVGALEELIYDTFTLPAAMRFFRPMENYRMNAAIVACFVVTILVLAAAGRKLRERSETVRRMFWVVCFLTVLVVSASAVLRSESFETLHDRSVFILSPATLLLSSYMLIRTWRKEALSGRNTRETMFLALVFITACQGFFMSFPRTDVVHVQVNSTVIFILIAFLLRKLYLAWDGYVAKHGKTFASALVAVCFVVLAASQCWSMIPFLSPGDNGENQSVVKLDLDFPRAEGLEVSVSASRQYGYLWHDLINISRFVRQHTRSDEKIFLLCEPQIVYFLSERDSFLRKEHYFVHLGTMGLIKSADVVRLTDEELLEKLIEARPRFIIRAPGGIHTQRITALWPRTAEYIDRHYRASKRISIVYEVLEAQGFMRNRQP